MSRFLALFLTHAGPLAWLFFALHGFTGRPLAIAALVTFATAGSFLSLQFLGRERPRFDAGSLIRMVGAFAGLSALAALAGRLPGAAHLSLTVAAWTGLVGTALVLANRLLLFACVGSRHGLLAETLRWLLLGGGVLYASWALYGMRSFGAGDSYWYTIMLADFVEQLRQGIFPVWVGQTEYAFNGAIFPLRVAPMFQHLGGLFDLLTAQTLHPLAIRKGVLAVNMFAMAASAYACLRCVAPSRPNAACALALLWVLCPGVLAPLYIGDQYMTCVAVTWLPTLLLGCQRLWAKDDFSSRLLIVVSLCGLWLSHTPIALWGSLVAAGNYFLHFLAVRDWRRELRAVPLMAAGFAAVGAFPISSALVLDNRIHFVTAPDSVLQQIDLNFPANFRPLNGESLTLASYQLGYSLVFVAVIAVALLCIRRPRGWLVATLTTLAFVPVILPVPLLTETFWTKVPAMFVTINNTWPMQRVFSVWSVVIVFAAALALAAGRGKSRLWQNAGWFLLFLTGIAWSGLESYKFVRGALKTRQSPEYTLRAFRQENVILTRYAYASFSAVPGYVSHGYVYPPLENRLLDRTAKTLIAANAEAAAPQLFPNQEPGKAPRVVDAGFWLGESLPPHNRYLAKAPLRIQRGQHYALRMEFAGEFKGVMALLHPELSREYLLPESGGGLPLKGLPRAFGTGPTSSRVLTFFIRGEGPAEVLFFLEVPEKGAPTMPIGHYTLYTYDPAQLPIQIDSWTPYTARVETAVPAYLETPRVWLSGWQAFVNKRAVAVERSPNDLVMIPLAAGESEVRLEFGVPWWLTLHYALSLAGWLAIGGLFTRFVIHRATLKTDLN